MKRILITGMSGVGKSSVGESLRKAGYSCVEMDEPGWSYRDGAGNQRWEVGRLREFLARDRSEVLFVVGCAEDQARFRNAFDATILLSVPKEIMLNRIRTRAGNSFGKEEGELERILKDFEEIEPLLRSRTDYEIVTTIPLAEVVRRILAIASARPRDRPPV